MSSPPVPAASPRPRQRRKEARPAELTAAALRLFVDKGFAATRLEDVARLAGVSKGALYLYFENKEALFEAVVREGILPTLEEGEAMIAAHRGCRAELLRALVLGWWELVGATPYGGIPKLIIAEARNFPGVVHFYHEQVINRGRRLLAQVLQEGMDSGEFRPMPLATAVDLVLAPVLMLTVWRHSIHGVLGDMPQHEPGLYLQTHLDLLLQGLLRQPGSTA
ncbi:MAG: TetR/AcrR family transcriptional regulator [Azovibrio sp.]|nr:TetR/AcrR family transcriptional regulator [Azovibrio sp.]